MVGWKENGQIAFGPVAPIASRHLVAADSVDVLVAPAAASVVIAAAARVAPVAAAVAALASASAPAIASTDAGSEKEIPVAAAETDAASDIQAGASPQRKETIASASSPLSSPPLADSAVVVAGAGAAGR